MKAAYEHNGQSVSAESFYALACDPARSLAVEACAGAGKTWVLVSRIVRALLDGALPQEILAITFTRRAAAEMRERLYQWLAEFAGAKPETLLAELRLRGLRVDDAQTGALQAERLSELYAQLLASGRQVQVRTFHGWFAALLRTAPLALLEQLELPASYELLEDDASAKLLVWRRFYATLLGDAPAKADFEALVFEHGRAQTEKALQSALDKRTEFLLADAHGVVEQSVQHFSALFPEFAAWSTPQDFLSRPSMGAQLLQGAARALGQADAKTFSAKGVELDRALAAANLPAVFDALLTEKGTPRKFSEKIVRIDLVRQAQAFVLELRAACQQHQAWLYQRRMACLQRLLLRDYATLKRERGWIDMNDLERAALVLLADPVLSGWAQQRLDAQVKHLLIDEFQDTNPLQWQALRSWLGAYAGAGGSAPSVFIVGDPKQSIYRFRRAEPQVFKAAQAFVRDGLGGDLLSCDHTRRSARAVVETVNAVMLNALQVDGYSAYREHTTSVALPGAVIRLPAIARPERLSAADDGVEPTAPWRDSLVCARELPEETLRTLEARQAAQWIAQHLANSSLVPSDVMVLARRRAALLPLQDELRRLQIAAQVGDKTDLIECCEVQDVVALLDVLVSTQNDLSLARVLKSPFFGMGDEALVQLRLAQIASGLSWFDVLQEADQTSDDGRLVGACLLRWKGWLDHLPPHDALQALYQDGDVLARFAVAAPAQLRDTVLANLRALLTVSLQLGSGRYATPYAWVRAIRAGGVRAPAAVNPQALRLLTIHGAKGLEANTVLLLDTDASTQRSETMTVLVDWPGEAAWPRRFVFLASESQPPQCAAATLEAEQLARRQEELNALYVALTRSRETLVVSSVVPHRAAQRSWWQRLLATEMLTEASIVSQGVGTASTLIATISEAARFELPVLPAAPPRTRAAEAPREGAAASARVGQAMHRLLEWGDARDAKALALARQFELTPDQALLAASMARRILQGAGAWAWDPDLIAWAGNEVGVHHGGQYCQLDRLVQRRDGVHAGEWWVLDYKSAHSPMEQTELLGQLHGYRAAVQAIYPGEVVRAAFLTAQGELLELEQGL